MSDRVQAMGATHWGGEIIDTAVSAAGYSVPTASHHLSWHRY